jgi:hypothetical protein
MSRITNYLTGSFLLILFLSCVNDGNNEIEKKDSFSQLKGELELDKFRNANIAENVEVNWNNVLQIEKKNVVVVEYDVNEKFPSRLQSSFLQTEVNYQLISIKSKGEIKNYFIEIFSYNDSDEYYKTITKLNNFRGVFNVFLLNGKNLGSIAVDHGNARNISESNALDFLAETINSFNPSSNITKKIPLCDGTYTQVVEQSQDRFRVVSNGYKILSVEYMDTVVTRTTNILPYPCDGSGDKDAIILQRIAQYTHGGNALGSEYYVESFALLASGPKIDPKKENKCFDVSKPATLTIYVQQGQESSRTLVGPNQVGHVFIGIKQNGIERVYGFYPESSASTVGVGVGRDYSSELRDNGKEMYHVSISKSISGEQLGAIVKYANSPPSTYNVNSYACTDFGIAVGKLGGINLPSTKATGWGFSGTSPGNLGEDIRAGSFPNTTKTTTKSTAPQRQGDCN